MAEEPPPSSEPQPPAPKPKPAWQRRVLRELPWLVLFAAAYFYISGDQAPAVKKGDVVAPIRAEMIGGGTFDSAASALPKVLVFWAPWCTVCAAEMPVLGDLRAELQGKAEVVGVALSGTKAEMDAFVAEHNPQFPSVYGSRSISQRFGIRAFPTIVVLDGNHVVRNHFVGITTPVRIRWAIPSSE